jgi:hypothetical protein
MVGAPGEFSLEFHDGDAWYLVDWGHDADTLIRAGQEDADLGQEWRVIDHADKVLHDQDGPREHTFEVPATPTS